MDNVHLFLIDIWLLFLGLFLALYVVLDGFDLGIGVLSLFVREDKRRGHHDGEPQQRLGRKRDLARRSRGRPVRRVSGRLCNHTQFALPPDHRDDLRSGLPRCRVRVPRTRARAAAVGFRVWIG